MGILKRQIQKITMKLRGWVNRTAKVKNVLPSYVILVVGLAISFYQFEQINADRAEDNELDIEDAERRQCFIARDTSIEIRDSFDRVMLELDIDPETIEIVLRALNQTEFNLDECLKDAGEGTST